MPNIRKILACILLCCLPLPALALDSLAVAADSSLGIPLAQIARMYARDKHVAVNVSFTAPRQQMMQIAEGGAADILITPEQQQIEQLKTQGLVDVYSQSVIAGNYLVLVGAADSPVQDAHFLSDAFAKEMAGGKTIQIASPEESFEGALALQTLQKADKDGSLAAHIASARSMPRRFLQIAEGRAYGVFFNSTVTGRPGVRIISPLPEAVAPPIKYYAVVIAGEKMTMARQFLDYLKTAPAQRLLAASGFTTN